MEHYKTRPTETIDAIRTALTEEEFRGYCIGNVMKYALRYQHKGGDDDLRREILEQAVEAGVDVDSLVFFYD